MSETLLKPQAARERKRPAGKAITGEWCVGVLAIHASGEQVVSSGDLQLRATRAASCLLEPATGDSVACLRIAPNEVWVMAVLQREEGTSNVLSCVGDMRISIGSGALELDARRIGLRAEELDVVSKEASISTEVADVVGKQLRLIGTSVKVVGSMMSSVFDRVQHFSRNYLRTTEGMDRVAATHLECEAKQLLRLEGEHTLVNGRELIKARGAQIHFG